MKKISELRKYFRNWYVRIFERLGLINGDVTYVLREYPIRITFKAKKTNTPFWIVEDMLYNDPYNNSKFVPSSNPIVIDVGANIGSFSLLQAMKWPSVSIYAYEAHPHNFKYLKQNIEQNKLEQKINIYNNAVVGKKTAETVRIYEHEDCGSNSLFLRKTGFAKTSYENTPVMELSQIFTDNNLEVVDMLKMDVEGSEYDILYGSENELRKVRFISLEYHEIEGQEISDLKEFLESIDFLVEEPKPHIWHCLNNKYK